MKGDSARVEVLTDCEVVNCSVDVVLMVVVVEDVVVVAGAILYKKVANIVQTLVQESIIGIAPYINESAAAGKHPCYAV